MKNKRTLGSLVSMAMAGGIVSSALWSQDSRACTTDTYVGAICLMASTWAPQYFLPADGRLVSAQQYPDLLQLLGTTYGGDGINTFGLPDLRGRVVLGAGASAYGPSFTLGARGGSFNFANGLPSHSHALQNPDVQVSWSAGTLQASTSLNGLSATLDLSQLSASINGSSLALKASSVLLGTNAPGGNALGTAVPGTKFYTATAPGTAMNAGSISGTAPAGFTGTATVSIASATPVATTLSGAPGISLQGGTEATGDSNPGSTSNLQPYLVMNYLIATQGLTLPRP